tara:strand:+ start:1261 stop:1443 length:183 start_codon:yes stop_codon:yes gene_type:complete
MTPREQIKFALKGLPISEKIAILETISNELRRLNSVRINAKQMGRKTIDEDRPDLMSLKN